MKTSLKCEFALFQTSSLIPFHSICQMLANFLELNTNGLFLNLEKDLFKKSVMHVQSCCFANPDLCFFSSCRSHCRRRRRLSN